MAAAAASRAARIRAVTARHEHRSRSLVSLLASLAAVLAVVVIAFASPASAAGTRVRANTPVAEHRVGAAQRVAADQVGRLRPPAVRFVSATGVATEEGMAGVRAAGAEGEAASGILKNTDRIPSLSGSAAYRIPDELGNGVLGEVKNVSSLSYTSQLRDFTAYAQQQGLQFNLYVRGSTVLSGPLQEAVDNGTINLIRNLPG